MAKNQTRETAAERRNLILNGNVRPTFADVVLKQPKRPLALSKLEAILARRATFKVA